MTQSETLLLLFNQQLFLGSRFLFWFKTQILKDPLLGSLMLKQKHLSVNNSNQTQ